MKNVIFRSPGEGDVMQMLNICRYCSSISQHTAYLFWLYATVFRARSLVAVSDAGVIGYLLSSPMPLPQEEFIIQLAILPEYQGNGLGIKLLLSHRNILRDFSILRVYSSIADGYLPGFALLKKAQQMEYNFIQIQWDMEAQARNVWNQEEFLFCAEV